MMKIHEYQAKEFFEAAGMPVPSGTVVTNPDDAYAAAKAIGKPVVVKAQVLVGGRGKAGGVKLAKDADEAKAKAKEILGMDIKGETVEKVLVTEAVDIATEIYVGIILDRATQKPLIMSSSEGGVEIEVVAKEKPEAIQRLTVDPLIGVKSYEARDVAMKLHPDFKVARQIAAIIEKLYTVYVHTDASLAEINPLIVTPEGEVKAIDAKINIDDSSLYR
ncbi:MAG: acetate--CoA ligase family protein, partial [Candidatus Latescibacterota bacterium]